MSSVNNKLIAPVYGSFSFLRQSTMQWAIWFITETCSCTNQLATRLESLDHLPNKRIKNYIINLFLIAFDWFLGILWNDIRLLPIDVDQDSIFVSTYV